MMSMGSLAHYMHDLSRDGFAIHEFLHEGNGEVWIAAVQDGPRPTCGWVAIEEQPKAATRSRPARESVSGLSGGIRARGGRRGVALYRAHEGHAVTGSFRSGSGIVKLNV